MSDYEHNADSRGAAMLRRKRRAAAATGPPPAGPRRRVEAIGRQASRHYCPTCGAKRSACRCPPAAA